MKTLKISVSELTNRALAYIKEDLPKISAPIIIYCLAMVVLGLVLDFVGLSVIDRVVQPVLTIFLAVTIHSHVMTKQKLDLFSFSSDHLGYLIRAVQVWAIAVAASLILVLPFLLAGYVFGFDFQFDSFFSIVFTGLFVIAIAVAAVFAWVSLPVRLCLIFPAAAVGDRNMTLRQSWEVTSKQTTKLILALLLAELPALLLLLAALLVSLIPIPGIFYLSYLIANIALVGGMVIGITVVSFIYKTYLEQNPPPAESKRMGTLPI